MGMSYLPVSAACTVLSFVGLQLWTQFSLGNSLKADESILSEEFINSGKDDAIELLSSSYVVVALLANFALNTFIFLILCLKAIFFAELYPSETRKLVERFINYVIYKGTFLPLVVPPTIFQAGFWSLWLIVLCSLKMFQALARDRLERLNLSPSTTPSAYFRVFSVLLVVLFADLYWIKLCVEIYSSQASSTFLLLFFEPCSIAFETLQAIVIHGFQWLDILINHSARAPACQRYKFLDIPPAGSLLEWKGSVIRNLGFVLDILTLSMSLGHYMHIWWLHGMAFHLVDAVLFLNIRALLSAVVKRVKGFIKLRIALQALHGALPDATAEELQAYEDECAICREPMAKAKRLNCKHLFHLACLRSWLDQGLSEIPSCPTCRKPLFATMPQGVGSPRAANISSDEQLARQISSALQRLGPGEPGPTRVFPGHPHNALESSTWREPGLGGSWLQSWPSQGLDGAGTSAATGAVGLGRVQLMMRQLASVGESYAQTALEDTAWNLWPPNSSHGATSTSPPLASATAVNNPDATAGFHIRSFPRSGNDDMANILAMVETVREVLPHVPDEMIFQDLQRTNSVTVTVNNLLQM